MDIDARALLDTEVRLLASDVVRAQALTGWTLDMRDAIDLATRLLVADRDTPSTLAVAQLSHGASFSESSAMVVDMLVEQGLDPRALSGTDAYATRLRAFSAGLLNASDIEGDFYDQLPDWEAQSPLDQVLVRLFDERDHVTDPVLRAEVESRMRAAVRDGAD